MGISSWENAITGIVAGAPGGVWIVIECLVRKAVTSVADGAADGPLVNFGVVDFEGAEDSAETRADASASAFPFRRFFSFLSFLDSGRSLTVSTTVSSLRFFVFCSRSEAIHHNIYHD